MNTAEKHTHPSPEILEADAAILSESAARTAQADLFAQATRVASASRRDGFPLHVQSFLEDFSLGTSDIVRVGPNVTFTRIRDSIVREFSLVSPGVLEGADAKTSWTPTQTPKDEETMSQMIQTAIDTLAREAGVSRE